MTKREFVENYNTIEQLNEFCASHNWSVYDGLFKDGVGDAKNAILKHAMARNAFDTEDLHEPTDDQFETFIRGAQDSGGYSQP